MMVLIQFTHLTLQVISTLVLHLATGGDTIDFSGYYFIHTFTSSGTFTPSQAFYADYLVVAGGGGGGGDSSGGGGAGGLRYSGASSLTATAYTVTVGGGGSVNVGGDGGSGSNSSIAGSVFQL
jgi:hypothetical protein